jgi:predicted phage tail protein
MRVIRLNGELGKRFGRSHKLDVRTPAEAVRALCANLEGFEQALASSHEKGVAYRCIVDRDPLDEGHLHYPMSRSFSITPVVHGGGKVLGIILGAILIVAAVALAPVTGGGSLLLTQGIGFLGFTYASVAWLGVALVLGGISQLLAPTPKAPTSGQTNENQYFNGAVNTTAQGSAVPIGYGRAIIGSAVISAAISVEQKPDPIYGDFRIGGYNLP